MKEPPWRCCRTRRSDRSPSLRGSSRCRSMLDRSRTPLPSEALVVKPWGSEPRHRNHQPSQTSYSLRCKPVFNGDGACVKSLAVPKQTFGL
jgi:hypothetical protein